MTEETTTIHLFDAENDETFPVYFYSNVIPRVGDEIYYWVDYPRHMTRDQRGLAETEDGEPEKVTGTVSRVEIEYRIMDYNPLARRVVNTVSVYLSGFTVTPYPKPNNS